MLLPVGLSRSSLPAAAVSSLTPEHSLVVISHVLQSQVTRCSWPFTGPAGRALRAASVAEACQAQLSSLTTPAPVNHPSTADLKEVLFGEWIRFVDRSQSTTQRQAGSTLPLPDQACRQPQGVTTGRRQLDARHPCACISPLHGCLAGILGPCEDHEALVERFAKPCGLPGCASNPQAVLQVFWYSLPERAHGILKGGSCTCRMQASTCRDGGRGLASA